MSLPRPPTQWGRRVRDFFETPLGAVTFLFLFLISGALGQAVAEACLLAALGVLSREVGGMGGFSSHRGLGLLGASSSCSNASLSSLPPAPAAVFTGAFWVILRVLFGLMWLGILCGPLIM